MSFQLLSTIKVKLVNEMMQRAYSCVILHVKHKKLPFVAVLTLFLILSKILNGDQDGDHCWWRHRPPAAPLPTKYTSSCWGDQRRNTATYQKLWGGVRLANGHNNFQHLWPNDVGSCCVCLHVAYSNEFHSSPSSFWERLSMGYRQCGFKKVVDVQRFGLKATNNSNDKSYIF